MNQSHSKPFKNVLITEYFSIYDTMRISSHAMTSKNNPPLSPKNHKKSLSSFLKVTPLPSDYKDSLCSNQVPRIKTMSFFHSATPQNVLTDYPKCGFSQKNHKKSLSDYFEASSRLRSDSKDSVSSKKNDKNIDLCVQTPIENLLKKSLKRRLIDKKTVFDFKKQKETQDFLNHLDLMPSNEDMKKLLNEKVRLKIGTRTSYKSITEHNIYSNIIDRKSMVKGLNERLFYGKRASLTKKTLPYLEDTVDPYQSHIKHSKVLKGKLEIGSFNHIESPLDVILRGSNYNEHQLLLGDLLKAVIHLKKQKNEKICIKLLYQLLGNCKKLLDCLIDNSKDPNQLFDPLTPRSFYLRLAYSGKANSKFNSIKSFTSIPTDSQTALLAPRPLLDDGFVRLLIDFKIRLQEASIKFQCEKYQVMKTAIIDEYEGILEKELNRLQKGKLEGRRKYERIKKDLKKRMAMGNFYTGSSVNVGLRNCEVNCGELVHVDKIEKAALQDLETAIFSIKCKQSDILKTIE